MANTLNELENTPKKEGLDVNVIQKQIPVTVGWGSKFFEVILWVLLIIPGLVFLFKKINAKVYLQKLEQKVQHDASQIDNYLEQRVVILQNTAKLVDRAIELDKDVMMKVAQYRGGGKTENDNARNETNQAVDRLFGQINVAYEQYPDLKAHKEIEEALKQNSYLQKEITAARELYNDTVYRWNAAIFEWPTKAIVAAKLGYTTRIPFTASQEVKEKARGVSF